MLWLMLGSLCILHGCLGADLTYTIEEEKTPGTFIGDIIADARLRDKIPQKALKLIKFSQLQQRGVESSQLIRVSKNSGKLFTAQSLDAETLCVLNAECFRMVDIAISKGTSVIMLLEIKIIIKDINDHQPEFPVKHVSIEFNEADRIGMRKSIPNARDKDVNVQNSQITYQLEKLGDEPFILSASKSVDGTSDLNIILEEQLDREDKDSYLVQVIAKDGASPPKQAVLDVNISVIDVNDNNPVFSKKVYKVSIKNEANEISPILVLSATDVDSGKNGQISYQFTPQTTDIAKKHFRLNETTGEIFISKTILPRQKLQYDLYIKATDKGLHPLSSIAKVQIFIIDQNNHAPIIDVKFFSASTKNTTNISEDIEVGSFIAYVKVTDHDVGQKGEVMCDLHHDKFKLQSQGVNKYKVILKKPLDRETEDHHDITISCEDLGSPPLHKENKFTIKVMDVDDVPPHFFKERYKFRIKENKKAGIDVGSINASDPDLGAGGELMFSLQRNKHKSEEVLLLLPFVITKDGFISTSESLDHELQDVYKFEVLVKDNGMPSLNNTVDVIVEVEDENDNSPYFTFPSVNPHNVEVVYFADESKNVTVVRAHDSDSQENAFLKYEISAGNEKQLFTIDHYSGLLSSTGALTKQDAGSYELEFVVKDSGMPVLSATTTIFLSLLLKNKSSSSSSLERVNGVLQNGESEEKVHLNMVIIITLLAVMVTIIVTASISICVLRCCNAASVDGDDVSNRYVSEQRHLMSSSYRGSSWPDVPTTMINDPNFGRSPDMVQSKRESYPSFINQSPAIRQQTSAEITHQGLPQEDSRSAVISPDFHTWQSATNSYTDSGRGWSIADVEPREDIQDFFSTHRFPPQSELHHNEKRHLKPKFHHLTDSTVPDRDLNQTVILPSRKTGDLKTDSFSSSTNVLSNINQTPTARPLPPVP